MIADVELTVTLVLWSVLLAVIILAVVPVVLYRAYRLIVASHAVRRHFEVTLTAAAGIVANTAPTSSALDETIAGGSALLPVVTHIDEHCAAIEDLLSQRVASGSR